MNAPSSQKIEAVIAEITAAFDCVSRGDAVTLHEASEWDDNYAHGRWIEIARAKDTDTKWQDVPDEWMAEMGLGDVALSYLDPEGFRYYLPAYMIWMLKSWRDGGVENNTEDAIIYHLSVNNQPARFSILNISQSKAVARFMEFLAEQPEDEYGLLLQASDAQKALKYYWGQFL
jgi:hypothetical protein